ncbi:hypothetical protein C0U44_32250, partial [Klebsiella pneumoniae]
DTTAFVGGINYSTEHMSDYGPEAKQDYAVQVEGPVVLDTTAFVGGINYSTEHMSDYGPEAKQDYAVQVEG